MWREQTRGICVGEKDIVEMCGVLALNEQRFLSAPLTHKIIGGSVDVQLFRPQRTTRG